MNEHLNSDVLSAYHDGEASSQERAEIERKLETSPELRAELNGLRALSGLLQELPRPELPPEFAAGVMQQAERQMLLTERLPTPQRRSRTKRYVAGAVIAAAAAAVLVMTQLDDSSPSTEEGGRYATSGVIGIAPDVLKGDTSVHVVVTDDTKPQAAEGAKKRVRGVPKMLANKPGLVPVEEVKLDELAIGQVVEALDTSNGKIAVVKLLAVDRHPGFLTVQKILTEQAIPEAGANASRQTITTSEMEAVYVQATRDQLVAALKEMQKEGLTVDSKSVEQLKVDELAPPAREVLAEKTLPPVSTGNKSPMQVLFVVEQKKDKTPKTGGDGAA